VIQTFNLDGSFFDPGIDGFQILFSNRQVALPFFNDALRIADRFMSRHPLSMHFYLRPTHCRVLLQQRLWPWLW